MLEHSGTVVSFVKAGRDKAIATCGDTEGPGQIVVGVRGEATDDSPAGLFMQGLGAMGGLPLEDDFTVVVRAGAFCRAPAASDQSGTSDDPPASTVVAASGALVCGNPESPFVPETAPITATIANEDGQWQFAWSTAGYEEQSNRWSDRNGPEVGSWRQQVELEYGPPGAQPVVVVRFLHERGASFSGARTDIVSLPDRLETNVTGSSVDGGPFQYRSEEFPALSAFEPALIDEELGLTTPGVVLENDWIATSVRVGGRIFTFADAGLHECWGELEREDVPAEHQAAFDVLGTDDPAARGSRWTLTFNNE